MYSKGETQTHRSDEKRYERSNRDADERTANKHHSDRDTENQGLNVKFCAFWLLSRIAKDTGVNHGLDSFVPPCYVRQLTSHCVTISHTLLFLHPSTSAVAVSCCLLTRLYIALRYCRMLDTTVKVLRTLASPSSRCDGTSIKLLMGSIGVHKTQLRRSSSPRPRKSSTSSYVEQRARETLATASAANALVGSSSTFYLLCKYIPPQRQEVNVWHHCFLSLCKGTTVITPLSPCSVVLYVYVRLSNSPRTPHAPRLNSTSCKT